MNPTKAAPGSVFSSTFEVLNKKKKKNTITGDPQWLNPQCFPWGEEVGKLHQTSKTQHCYKNSKKTKAALRDQVHSSKTKRKIQVCLGFLFSSPKIPKVVAGKPHSGGFTRSGNSSGAGPGLQPSPSPRSGSGRKAAKDGKWWKFGSLLPGPAP